MFNGLSRKGSAGIVCIMALLFFSSCGINYHRSRISRHWQKIEGSIEKYPELKEEVEESQVLSTLESRSPQYQLDLKADTLVYRPIIEKIVEVKKQQQNLSGPQRGFKPLSTEEVVYLQRVYEDSLSGLYALLERKIYKDTVITVNGGHQLLLGSDTVLLPYLITLQYQNGIMEAQLQTQSRQLASYVTKKIQIDAHKRPPMLQMLSYGLFAIAIILAVFLLFRLVVRLFF